MPGFTRAVVRQARRDCGWSGRTQHRQRCGLLELHARAAIGYTVNGTPAPGAVAVWPPGGGNDGHVGYVDSVNADGTINTEDCANPRGAYMANLSRPDVGSAYPGFGDLHGFDITLALPEGLTSSKTYCVYAINVGAGSSARSWAVAL